MTQPLSLTPRIFDHLTKFSHPHINPQKTDIYAKNTPPKSRITLKLYHPDTDESIDQNLPTNIPDIPYLPGISFMVDEHLRDLEISTLYLKPSYQHHRIGTALITHLIAHGKTLGLESLSCIADVETNAKTYWQNIHGFITPRIYQPQYHYKKL